MQWKSEARDGAKIECYWQNESEFAKSDSRRWGSDSVENGSWTNLGLNVWGDFWVVTSNPEKLHLVCRTSGTVKSLRGSIEILNFGTSTKIGTSRPSSEA